MAARVGEMANTYKHSKHKKKRGYEKLVKIKEYTTEGLQRDQFFETDDGLRWEAPNFKNARKTKKKAWLSKTSEGWLYIILLGWLKKTEKARFVFKLGERRIRQLVDAELKKYDEAWHTHCLRHSRATHIAEISSDPFVVQAVLGHGRLETSSRYVNIAEERLRQKLAGRPFEELLGVKV